MNLAFVLDRSGSMAGRGKLELAKQGVLEALDRLDADRPLRDRHVRRATSTWSSSSTPATPEARHTAARALRAIEPRGSTNLAGGWMRGAEQVAVASGATARIDRVLLLTDGLANVGITDPARSPAHAAELRARGIATSTIGVGDDFDESLLQALADAGGGHFYFAGSLPEIRDHLTSEVGEALEVVARDVRLTVTSIESVTVRPLTPHPFDEGGSHRVFRLGELVQRPARPRRASRALPGGRRGCRDRALLRSRTRTASSGPSRPSRRRHAGVAVSDAANDVQPRDRMVDRAVAELFAARARQESVALNRSGDWQRARAPSSRSRSASRLCRRRCRAEGAGR